LILGFLLELTTPILFKVRALSQYSLRLQRKVQVTIRINIRLDRIY